MCKASIFEWARVFEKVANGGRWLGYPRRRQAIKRLPRAFFGRRIPPDSWAGVAGDTKILLNTIRAVVKAVPKLGCENLKAIP